MFSKPTRLLFCAAILAVLLPLIALPSIPTSAQDSSITIGTLDLPISLDPALADNFVSWEILSHLYTGLTRQQPGTTDYELAVATSHQVSPDGLTHTFTLRPDVTFTDGTLITATTFANSINRVLRLDRSGAALIKTLVASVTAVEAHVLEFKLAEPVPYFMSLVSLPVFFATHPDDFPANDIQRELAPLTGNGVYTLDTFAISDFIRLKANPAYQFGNVAKTPEITLKQYLATDELQLALLTHQVDMAWRDVLLPDAGRIGNQSNDIIFESHPSIRLWYLVINADLKFDGTARREVRQSILTLINRRRITESYFGGYTSPAYSLVPEMLGGAYNPVWDVAPDPDAAVALLTGLGYRRNGNNAPPMAIVSTANGYGDYYADATRSFSVDFVALRPYLTIGAFSQVDAPVFYRGIQSGDIQIGLFAWTPLVAHPDTYLRPLLHSTGLLARANRYSSEELDSLLDQARLTDDATLYQQAQQLAYATYTLVPLWQDSVSILYWNDIAGVTLEANYFLHYDLLERQ
jgi:peptide/nickel transport system substrate-binding protein